MVDLAAVLHEEAAGAGELVRLSRQDPHRELLTGEIGPRQLVGVRGLGLVLIDRRGRSFAPASLQLLDRVVTRLVVILAGGNRILWLSPALSLIILGVLAIVSPGRGWCCA